MAACFFAELADNPGKSIPFDVECANRLRKMIVEKRKRRQAWSRKKWADDFRKLRGELDDGENRIRQALDWYENNIGKEYVPIADSAMSFRKKFDRIEELSQAAVKKEVVVSEYARRKARELATKYTWPKGSAFMLPQVVQMSYESIKLFLQIAKELKTPFSRFLHNLLCSIGNVLDRWFAEVHNQVRSWSTWSGKLDVFAFKFTSPILDKWGRAYSTNYSGSDKAWNDFKRHL